MTDGGGEDEGLDTAPGALASGRLRWHLELATTSLVEGTRAGGAMGGTEAQFLAWWATTVPLLFTSSIECGIEEAIAAREDAGADESKLADLPWLYATCIRLGIGSEPVTRLVEGVVHHSSAMRAAVNQSLALVADELSFEDRQLQIGVEECIRRQYTDCEDAALVLLATSGSSFDKRRWAAAQLVRHVGHGARLRQVLEAAADGRPVPNTLLAPMAQGAISALAPLSTVVPSVPPLASPQPADWPKLDALRLGADMWPGLIADRLLRMPFLQAQIELN